MRELHPRGLLHTEVLQEYLEAVEEEGVVVRLSTIAAMVKQLSSGGVPQLAQVEVRPLEDLRQILLTVEEVDPITGLLAGQKLVGQAGVCLQILCCLVGEDAENGRQMVFKGMHHLVPLGVLKQEERKKIIIQK
jgi:hypothetical protein